MLKWVAGSNPAYCSQRAVWYFPTANHQRLLTARTSPPLFCTSLATYLLPQNNSLQPKGFNGKAYSVRNIPLHGASPNDTAISFIWYWKWRRGGWQCFGLYLGAPWCYLLTCNLKHTSWWQCINFPFYRRGNVMAHWYYQSLHVVFTNFMLFLSSTPEHQDQIYPTAKEVQLLLNHLPQQVQCTRHDLQHTMYIANFLQ